MTSNKETPPMPRPKPTPDERERQEEEEDRRDLRGSALDELDDDA